MSDGFVFELFRPRLRPQAVVNSADFSNGALAPGEILSLFGAGLGPDELIVARADSEGRLPRQLGLTRVLFGRDGIAISLYSMMEDTARTIRRTVVLLLLASLMFLLPWAVLRQDPPFGFLHLFIELHEAPDPLLAHLRVALVHLCGHPVQQLNRFVRIQPNLSVDVREPGEE